MKLTLKAVVAALCVATTGLFGSLAGEPEKVIALWPRAAPGENGEIGEEHEYDQTERGPGGGQRVIRLGNVSKPTIAVYRPRPRKTPARRCWFAPGAVIPSWPWTWKAGGLRLVEFYRGNGCAIEVSGPETAEEEGHTLPLQDAQRALGLVRHHAQEGKSIRNGLGRWGFPRRICSQHIRARIDMRADASCGPFHACLIYSRLPRAIKESEHLCAGTEITETPAPQSVSDRFSIPGMMPHQTQRPLSILQWQRCALLFLRFGTRYFNSTPVTPIEFNQSQTSVPSRSMARMV